MQKPAFLEKILQWRPPHLGQRIVKTTVAVFLCLIVYYLRGYHGKNMPTEAAITAIICMQPYVKDTRFYSISRIVGSVIGSVLGLGFLFLLYRYPLFAQNMLILNAVMALGVLISLYVSVMFRMPDASSLAAIVFLCVVIAFPEIEDPLGQAWLRIIDVSIGTGFAILVNVFRLPRDKNRDTVFFLRSSDLVPDHFSQLPSAALFKLNYLNDDGARICLISEHAPAFLTIRMSAAKLALPLIVMDGAAIYDPNDNEYLHTETIRLEDSEKLRAELKSLGVNFFTYTVHKNKTCIFHEGQTTHEERMVLNQMRSSPYRSYLEGEIYDPSEIVYYKIVDTDEKIIHLEHELEHILPEVSLRMVIREQARVPGVSGLYIYSREAYVEKAQIWLMDLLHKTEPHLKSMEVQLRGGYHSERDAIQLLNTVTDYYEPIKKFWKKKEEAMPTGAP